jgi:hypothetical protein
VTPVAERNRRSSLRSFYAGFAAFFIVAAALGFTAPNHSARLWLGCAALVMAAVALVGVNYYKPDAR